MLWTLMTKIPSLHAQLVTVVDHLVDGVATVG